MANSLIRLPRAWEVLARFSESERLLSCAQTGIYGGFDALQRLSGQTDAIQHIQKTVRIGGTRRRCTHASRFCGQLRKRQEASETVGGKFAASAHRVYRRDNSTAYGRRSTTRDAVSLFSAAPCAPLGITRGQVGVKRVQISGIGLRNFGTNDTDPRLHILVPRLRAGEIWA